MCETTLSCFDNSLPHRDTVFDIPHSGFTVRVRQPSENSSIVSISMLYTPCSNPGIFIDELIEKTQNVIYNELPYEMVAYKCEPEIMSIHSGLSLQSVDIQRCQYHLLSAITEGKMEMPNFDEMKPTPIPLSSIPPDSSAATLFNPHQEGKPAKKNKIKAFGSKISNAVSKVKRFFGRLKLTKNTRPIESL